VRAYKRGLCNSSCKRSSCVSNVYNIRVRVVSDIQTLAENNLKNDSSYKFIGEVILKINVV
jgi:hypothetical protein